MKGQLTVSPAVSCPCLLLILSHLAGPLPDSLHLSLCLAYPRLSIRSACRPVARCGSCANESAFKAAFMTYRHRQRLLTDAPEFTPEEMSSCMKNAAPGSPALSVLSFTSAFHG